MHGYRGSKLRAAWERLEASLSFAQPAVEIFGALRGLAWGGWSITHADLFRRYPKFFAPLEAVAPPWVWGVAVASLGAMQLGAFASGNREVRRCGCLLACMGWSGLAWIYFRGDSSSLGIPLLICDALAAGWAYLRLGDDYGRGRHGGTE